MVLGTRSAVMLQRLGCGASPRGLCSGPPAAGMRSSAERSCVCTTAAAGVPQPGTRCEDPLEGVWAGRHVPLCKQWGRAPFGWQQSRWAWVAPGPAQENAPSRLWDAVEDFSKRFFPFLSKPAALMESLVQAGALRAPCGALLCCPPHPCI